MEVRNMAYPEGGSQKKKQIWRYETLQEIKSIVSDMALDLRFYVNEIRMRSDQMLKDYKTRLPEIMKSNCEKAIKLAKERHYWHKTLHHPYYFRKDDKGIAYKWFIVYTNSIDICIGYGYNKSVVFSIRGSEVYRRD